MNIGIFLIVWVSCFSEAITGHKVKRDALPKQRIATVPSAPYVYFDSGKSGNDRYSGFLPELIEDLSNRIGFEYEFYQPDDRRYGVALNDSTWNGMIGEVLKNQNQGHGGADMAAADITITPDRAKVVDFLHPFANVGITGVIQKPHPAGKPANATVDSKFDMNFDIFKPLAVEIWIVLIIFVVVVWLFLWLMNRFNPYEYGERYKRNLATADESEMFSLTGSLWYTFTILQWQGYDRSPRSLASKMLSCCWMAFVTITLVTYIGSFVNYLFWASTVHTRPDYSVLSQLDLKDLINHREGFTYGVVKGGSTYRFLTKVARGEEFQLLTKYWETQDGQNNIVSSVEEGITRARTQPKFVFLLETPQAKYYMSKRPCDLMQVGINVGMRSYGIAINKDSPVKEKLHQGILEMLEDGEIAAIEDRWFSDHECWNVTSYDRSANDISGLYVDKPQKVTIRIFWSPLVIMCLAVLVSGLVGLAEYMYYKYRGQYDANNRSGGSKLTEDA